MWRARHKTFSSSPFCRLPKNKRARDTCQKGNIQIFQLFRRDSAVTAAPLFEIPPKRQKILQPDGGGGPEESELCKTTFFSLLFCRVCVCVRIFFFFWIWSSHMWDTLAAFAFFSSFRTCLVLFFLFSWIDTNTRVHVGLESWFFFIFGFYRVATVDTCCNRQVSEG